MKATHFVEMSSSPQKLIIARHFGLKVVNPLWVEE